MALKAQNVVDPATVALHAAEQRIRDLEAQLAAKSKPVATRMAVSEKGGLSLYGMNAQFPVTLYPDQWRKVLGLGEEFEAFMAKHEREFRIKGESLEAYCRRMGKPVPVARPRS